MGVFRVQGTLNNWQNRFLAPEYRGETVCCDLVVDTGAVELALPADLIAPLKLEAMGVKRVFTADGARHDCRIMGMVELEVQGRTCEVCAIELPPGAVPLLGAVPLEEMDWHVNPGEGRLMPNPLSPDEALLRI